MVQLLQFFQEIFYYFFYHFFFIQIMVIFKIYSSMSTKLILFLILKKYRVPIFIKIYLVLFIYNLIFYLLRLYLFKLLRT